MNPITTVRRGAAALVVALLIAAAGGAGGVWASHQFSDVGNGNFFHTAIGNIASAGCASGFNDGTFGPNRNATRGQFAYWTNNCGGRIDYDQGSSFLVGTSLQQLASVSVTAGALDNPPLDTGGYVWVNAALEATDGTNTACEVAITFRRNGAFANSVGLNPTGPASTNYASGAINRVFAIDGGDTDSFQVLASSSGCTGGTAAVEVGLSAMYVPFDGDGIGGGAAGAAESLSGPEPEAVGPASG